MNGGPRGFTLIELMTVVVVIGILASVAIVRYRDVLRKATEGATRGNLGTIRSAVHIYYADTEGGYPETLAYLSQNSKYLRRIPETDLTGYHVDSTAVREGAGITTQADDAGGWLYNGVAADANFGTVWVNCTHTDSLSTVWTAY